MGDRLRIIVTGLVAQYPLGGVAWDYMQWVIGLARLGHDVYYVEDNNQWPYNPLEGGLSKDCRFNLRYLDQLMRRFALPNRWAYRFAWRGEWFGLPEHRRRDVLKTADVLVNVSGVLARLEEYRCIPKLVYVDSDPVFTHVKLQRGQDEFRSIVDSHDVHFTFGETLPEPLRDTGHEWHPIRQPIVLSEWHPEAASRKAFTTIMNWTSYKPVAYDGRTYGQKDEELARFLDLPRAVNPTELELALNAGKTRRAPFELLAHRGWKVVDPAEVCPDLDSYRRYVQSSLAEWSVAKNGYVEGSSGWFSCRSACYLACGKPVVLQDTGYSKVLPTGRGIVAFSTFEDAVAGIQSVVEHYDEHSEAARALAESRFDSDAVLGSLIERAFQDRPATATAAR
jgi:hypothetical protein